MRWLNKRGLLVWVLSALAETAVTIPWVMFTYWASGLSDWPAALPGVWVFLFAYGAAAAWEAGRPAATVQTPQSRIIALIVGLAMVYLLVYEALPLGIRPDSRFNLNAAAAVLPPAAYLWYQGARSATLGLQYSRVFARFTEQTVTMVVSVLFLIVVGIAGDARVQVLLLWSIFLLFGAGSTLIIIAREHALHMDQVRHGETGTGTDVLPPAAVALVGGLVSITLASSYLLSVERLVTTLETLGGLLAIPFTWAVDVAMLVIIRWMMMVGALVAWFGSLIPRPKHQEREIGDVMMGDPLVMEGILQEGPLRDWDNYLRVALILTSVVVLLILVYRLGRSRREFARSDEEQRISLGFWQGLLADLRGLFRRKTFEVTAVVGESGHFRDDPIDPRALFRRLQHWGSGIGRPRRASETPSGYGAALLGRHQAAEQAITEVTETYNQARYGPMPPDAEKVQKAASALEKLQSSQEEQHKL